MNRIISIFVLSLFLFTHTTADEIKKDEFKQYQAYGSRLAYAQAQMLAHKTGQEKDKYGWRRLSGYGLHSNVYGGVYSARRSSRGFDLYTGRTAVSQSLAKDSISSTSHGQAERTLEISNVESVIVRSHPWEEMLQTVEPGPALSPLFKLAPQDSFVIYFEEGRKIGELENSLSALVEGADPLFNFQQSASATEMIAKRLGVENFRKLEPLMGETLFIAEDVDFYPNTHYALAFQVSDLAKIGANLLIDSEAKGRVGDAFVLATSKELLDAIRACHAGESESLADSKDLAYCNSVLDKERDGFCYFSESFIEKLVSPAYRINSARRLAAIDSLCQRQYSVLAYRCITDQWPTSFDQMVEEGYLPAHDDDTDFTVQKDGTVEHKIWGSLENLKPLSEVPIERISEGELEEYHRFKIRYDRLWTTFFDPVGIAFTVDKQVRFHTIILPLVNSREYNWLQLISGGEPIALDNLSPIHKNFPASLHMRFNSEDVILMLFNNFRPLSEDDDRERAKVLANHSVRSRANLDEDFDLFEVVGNQLHISYGPELSLEGFGKLDLLVSLQLKDIEAFKELMSSNSLREYRKEKQIDGIDYVEYSNGSKDLALYAVYHENYIHLALYKPTFETLCSAIKNGGGSTACFDSDWLGTEHNMLARADIRESGPSFLNALKGDSFYATQSRVMSAAAYHYDILMLEKAAGAAVANRFFPYPPKSVLAVPLELKEQEVTMGGVPISKISFRSFWAKSGSQKKGEVSLEEVLEQKQDQGILDKMALFEQATVGLKFTEEGLSTRVSINNPAYAPLASKSVTKENMTPTAVLLGGSGLVLLLLIIGTQLKAGSVSDDLSS